MPNNNETTTKFKVDISELKSAMQEAKRQIQVTNSEFKAISSGMDNWAESTDGVSAKLKQLDGNLKSQEKILDSLEEQYELTVKQMGEGSVEADRLKIAINNQKAVVNNTKKEIAKYEDTLDELSNISDDAGDNTGDLAEELDNVSDKAKDAGDGFTVFKGAVATFVGNGLTKLVDGLKGAVSSIANLSDETREYREDMAKLQTAFEMAGISTEDATKLYKDFYAVLGEEDRSVEAVNHLAKFVETEKDMQKWTDICTGVWGTFGDSLPIEGLTEASNETMKTGKLTGVLADALNWAGVNEDDFQASLDGCTTEQARQALITETLNALYGDTADAYRENNKEVMEANRANSDYTDTMAELGAKLEPLTTTLKTGFTELLQEALKLVEDVDFDAFKAKVEEAFKTLKEDVLPAVKEGLGWIVDHKDELIAGIGGIATALVTLNVANMIMGVVKAFQAFKLAQEGATIAQWLLNVAMSANPIGIIVALIAGLVTAFVILWNKSEGFRNFWIGLWEGIKEVTSTVVEAVKKFFTETIPNAFNTVVTAVSDFLSSAGENIKNFFTVTIPEAIQTAIDWFLDLPNKIAYALGYAIGAIGKWCIDTYMLISEKIPEIIDNITTFFSELPSKIWTWLVNTITKVSEWATQMKSKATETAKSFIENAVTYIKELPSKIWTWLVNTITKITQWKNDMGKKGKEAIKEFVDNVIEGAKDIPDKMLSIGKNIVDGVWNGIQNAKEQFLKNVKGFFGNIVEGAQDALGIESPSKVFAKEVGKWIPAGIAVGINDNAKTALKSMKDLTSSMVLSTKDSLSNTGVNGVTGITGGVVNNFTQVINSPKQLNRLDIYRQSKNLLGYAGGGM